MFESATRFCNAGPQDALADPRTDWLKQAEEGTEMIVRRLGLGGAHLMVGLASNDSRHRDGRAILTISEGVVVA